MAKQKPKAADPDLLGRLWNNMILSWRLMLDRRVSVTSKLLIPVLMALYLISPIDLIPDFLLPFGVADDLGVLLLGLQLFIRSAPPGVVDEYRRRAQGMVNPGTRRREDDPRVIEGEYHVRDEDE